MRWTYRTIFLLYASLSILELVVHALPTIPQLNDGDSSSFERRSPAIRTKRLRSSSARKTAIARSGKDKDHWKGYDADHILELQTVTHYINVHGRTTPGPSQPCLTALKAELNKEKNLDMLPSKVNGQKGKVVGQLNNKPKHKDREMFHGEAAAYINKHEHTIMETAAAIDHILTDPSSVCNGLGITDRNGIQNKARCMVEHANPNRKKVYCT